MRFASLYLVGYVIFMIGVGAALWKLGVIERIGTTWTAIGFLIVAGIGIMLSMGGKRSIEIDQQ
jgi:hypothetical protein